MGRLTLHVLDTARGCPGRGLRVELFRLSGDGKAKIAETVTDADGRCPAPLLEGDALTAGTYELLFHAGAYFDGFGHSPDEPGFLDLVPIRFGVADPNAHYHVPLLLSPFGYTTYRGS